MLNVTSHDSLSIKKEIKYTKVRGKNHCVAIMNLANSRRKMDSRRKALLEA